MHGHRFLLIARRYPSGTDCSVEAKKIITTGRAGGLH